MMPILPSSEPADEAVTAVQVTTGVTASSMQQAVGVGVGVGGRELDPWDSLFGLGDLEDDTAPRKTIN